MTLQTKRLLLRPWEEKDLEPFTRLNQDPKVMEYFPSTLSKEESKLAVKRFQTAIQEKGWGLWAAELLETGEFIGFIGLQEVPYETPFTPSIEIGWRLAFSHWGKGYATEGAKACLQYAFEVLHLNEIVSFTTLENSRSRRVMEKIGLYHDPQDDFDHPKLSKDHPLKRHVLYRLKKKQWLEQNLPKIEK